MAQTKSVALRKPHLDDGGDIWQLIKSTKVLDLNSAYYYLILCKYFKNTCVVAEEDHGIVGFVSAFIHPENSKVLFVWQVAVDQSQRGKGLASSLLEELVSREECASIQFIETTISPSNEASKALFKKFAHKLGTKMEETETISQEAFPSDNHESEQTYQIGPFH
ncbi:diaminobutyrate acetyltransferase [Salipaludibacillus sp. CF4.18]|uniref:diaminobutyrate acetyltransferase n=1 Tax=Salipaludibacillus sp. CF4.18 TaxID=3373081 RepID=UPI003EE75A5C